MKRLVACLVCVSLCLVMVSGGVLAGAETAYVPVTIQNFDRSTEYTAKPQRVVVLTLNSAEIISALGEADVLVAIARNLNTVDDVLPEYRDALAGKPFPEEINSGVPTLEAVISLDPGMMIANSYYFNVPTFGTMEDYAANKINCYVTEGSYVPGCTVENTYNDIRNIGAILGRTQEAETLVAQMQTRLSAVADGVKGKTPLKVLSFDSVYENSIMVAGGTGLVQDLITLAGGSNIFSDLTGQFGAVTMEEIISRNPDIIVIHEYTNGVENDAQAKIDYFKSVKELSDVSAIKNDRFVVVPLVSVNPGLQNADYVESLAAAMYPEAF